MNLSQRREVSMPYEDEDGSEDIAEIAGRMALSSEIEIELKEKTMELSQVKEEFNLFKEEFDTISKSVEQHKAIGEKYRGKYNQRLESDVARAFSSLKATLEEFPEQSIVDAIVTGAKTILVSTVAVEDVDLFNALIAKFTKK